ncbi:MAG: alcohol dehydrogenase catalytic domain-containing protein [Planctomycetota bacterium]
MPTATVPATQTAVQLVGPDQLSLNLSKPVSRPGPRQILAKVECVGLCFSDMKLLHQFDQHARKSPVLKHLAADVLAGIPSYVPDGKPTVPGHEAVVRVIEIGAGVTSVKAGGRYLVQADWRDLKTDKSNGAFGYNFEGGLQQYVLMDERTTIAADGTSYLLPVPEERGASQLALVEPWACVEEAFIHRERQNLKAGGTVLLVVAPGAKPDLTGLDLTRSAKLLCLQGAAACTPPKGFTCVKLDAIAKTSIDDLVVVGADAAVLESVFPLVATEGLILIAQAGATFGRPVSTPVGRVHYGNVRIAGTTSAKPADALKRVPASGEVRPGDHVHVIGAAGPMGSMAVLRLVSLASGGTSIDGSDMSAERLDVLSGKATPVAKRRNVALHLYNAKAGGKATRAASYHMVMVPIPAVVAGAVNDSVDGGVVNIFAGIPADVSGPIDLDAYCRKGLYFIGTSGSTMEDMQVVLAKVLGDQLDTNLSVGAVTGFGGAIAGLEAVKTGKISGKILVYPDLGDFPLTELPELVKRYPSIGPKLKDGCWTKAAEVELLAVAGKK